MSVTNDYVPFCGTDTGTNLLSQADYLADPQLAIGNQTGVARSKLVNKVLRQASFVASGVAQLAANATQTNTLDNANSTEFLAQLKAAILPISPYATKLLSGSGTFNMPYAFFCGSINATVGSTYTNNSFTYTVLGTVSSASLVYMSGPGAPSAGGTLTLTSGSGDATIVFYASRAPLFYELKLIGGGGGAAGSGTGSMSDGGDGGDTTFGTSLLTAGGGLGSIKQAPSGGSGGTPTLAAGPFDLGSMAGNQGEGAVFMAISSDNFPGGSGGASILGGAPSGGYSVAGGSGATNSGSGGAGGGAAFTNAYTGPGGGSGASVLARIHSPALTYPFSVGTAGSFGTAGSNGFAGGAGGSGVIFVTACFQ